MLLPKLMALNSVNFDLNECNFNDADNNKKDLKGDSREGSGRATVYKLSGSPLCYTLEGNYATGLRINTLQPRTNVADGQTILKEDFAINDTSSGFYKKRKIPLYDREVFEDVGRSFLISLLDLTGTNPVSRLPNVQPGLEAALSKVRSDLKRELERDSIKKMKAKAKAKKGKKKAANINFELVCKEDDENDVEPTADPNDE